MAARLGDGGRGFGEHVALVRAGNWQEQIQAIFLSGAGGDEERAFAVKIGCVDVGDGNEGFGQIAQSSVAGEHKGGLPEVVGGPWLGNGQKDADSGFEPLEDGLHKRAAPVGVDRLERVGAVVQGFVQCNFVAVFEGPHKGALDELAVVARTCAHGAYFSADPLV